MPEDGENLVNSWRTPRPRTSETETPLLLVVVVVVVAVAGGGVVECKHKKTVQRTRERDRKLTGNAVVVLCMIVKEE